MTVALEAEPESSAQDTPFVVAIEGFTGPLDLLLHLVREEQLDLADIPVARIADQFLRAIQQLGLDQAADYLEMAGRLVRLKAQLLLPRHGDDEAWEDPRAELVRRLLEYQQVKEIALELARLAEKRSQRFARGLIPPPLTAPPPAPVTLDLLEMLRAVEAVITNIPSPVLHSVVPRRLDVEGATVRLEALLEMHETFDWREALGPSPTVADVISVLIALLELAKRGQCSLRQDLPFAPLVIARESANPTAQLLEAALFAANRPITLEELGNLDPEAAPADIRAGLDELREHYDFGGHAIELVEMAGGYQILTRASFAAAVERAQLVQRQSRLSAATLETLSTIAYRQPVGRAEIEEIRGVSSGGVLRTLQERGLIEVVGRSESLGRPLLYGTTALFLELLGLNDLADLPRTDELTIALQPHRPERSDEESSALALMEEG